MYDPGIGSKYYTTITSHPISMDINKQKQCKKAKAESGRGNDTASAIFHLFSDLFAKKHNKQIGKQMKNCGSGRVCHQCVIILFILSCNEQQRWRRNYVPFLIMRTDFLRYMKKIFFLLITFF